LNRRKPILMMLVLGLGAIVTLSLLPRSFSQISHIGEHVKATLEPNAPPMLEKPQPISGPPPTTKPVFDAQAWYTARNEQTETHGVFIESLDGSHLYASHNADVTFNPASLVKLATTLAALKSLGADYRFPTKVSTDGAVDNVGILQGELYVTGSDPTFGDATANVIANELRARGIKKLTKPVRVSPQFCFNFTDKPEEAGSRLVKALKMGNPPVEVSEQPSGQALITVSSNPLRDVLLYMNAHSSNFIAERVGDLIGGPEGLERFLVEELKFPADQVAIARTSGREHNRMTPRGVVTVIRKLVEETWKLGIQASDVMPVASDDSGTLRRRLDGTGLEGSVVGKTGTLTHEVDGGVASLAGIVYTKDAGALVFAILDQGNRIAENREMEDQLLAEIVHMSGTPMVISSPEARKLLPRSNLAVGN
jgi:D-alanyl-D-alanine carboxypeptidase/D-alanyl-D-alanine-endopeptidase (penicillin-binding protein 4)